MKIPAMVVGGLAFGAVFQPGFLAQSAFGQGLLNESGSAILAPVLVPTGGYAGSPQEYLTVAWSVTENASQVYTYSYNLHNPAGDVLLNSDGTLTTTPETFDYFSVGFDTSLPGAYVNGSATGAAFQASNPNGVAWFFNPSIAANSSSPTVSFLSSLAPGMGNGQAADGSPPSPWSSVNPMGSELPVPAIPEPSAGTLLGESIPLLLLTFRATRRMRRAAGD